MSASAMQSILVSPAYMGWMPATSAAPTAFALSAANNWYAQQFTLPQSKTLNTVRFWVNSVAGTLASGDIEASLYADNGSGAPGSLISSSTTVNAVPTAAAWVTVSGFTDSLSAFTRYWIVLKNKNGTPGTNAFTLMRPNGGNLLNSTFSSGIKASFLSRHSTDGGGSWLSNIGTYMGMRLGFSDGSFVGYPMLGVASSGSGRLFGTREQGAVFTPQATVHFDAVLTFITKLGTPTGTLKLRFRTGSDTPVTADTTYNNSTVTGGAVASFNFNTPQQLVKGQPAYLTLWNDDGGADGLSNCFEHSYHRFDPDADSLPLYPFGGTIEEVNTTDNTANPIVWSDSDATHRGIPILFIAAKFDDPFPSSGSGGIKRSGGNSGGHNRRRVA